MDPSISAKDEIWFLRVCHHCSTGLYTRPFRRKTNSGFCACAITFQLASTLVRFAERRNLVSARVPSHFNWPLHSPVSPKDEIWFLRVCHHFSTGLYTRPFRRKTKSGFCACAITFQTHSNTLTTKQARNQSPHTPVPSPVTFLWHCISESFAIPCRGKGQ